MSILVEHISNKNEKYGNAQSQFKLCQCVCVHTDRTYGMQQQKTGMVKLKSNQIISVCLCHYVSIHTGRTHTKIKEIQVW